MPRARCSRRHRPVGAGRARRSRLEAVARPRGRARTVGKAAIVRDNRRRRSRGGAWRAQPLRDNRSGSSWPNAWSCAHSQQLENDATARPGSRCADLCRGLGGGFPSWPPPPAAPLARRRLVDTPDDGDAVALEGDEWGDSAHQRSHSFPARRAQHDAGHRSLE